MEEVAGTQPALLGGWTDRPTAWEEVLRGKLTFWLGFWSHRDTQLHWIALDCRGRAWNFLKPPPSAPAPLGF